MTKLGFHVSAGNRKGFGEALKLCADAGNPVPVIFSVDQDVWPDVQKYSPVHTTVIFRTQKDFQGAEIGDGPNGIYQGDAVQSAHAWMNSIMPVWRKNKAHYYAPLNEQDPPTLAAFAWLNTFTMECMTIAEANGSRLALYAFSGGNPKDVLQPAIGQPFTAEDAWRRLVPSLQMADQRDHILLLHEYGFDRGTLRASAPDLALRYRRAYAELVKHNATPRLVISEASAGVGYGGMDWQGWMADALWYDGELQRDGIVLGCCLYQLGGAENFAGIMPLLSDAMAKTPTREPEAVIVVGIVDEDVPAGCTKLIVAVDYLRVRVQPTSTAAIVKRLMRNETVYVRNGVSVDETGYRWVQLHDGTWCAAGELSVSVVYLRAA
jgi:hypothetical protein